MHWWDSNNRFNKENKCSLCWWKRSMQLVFVLVIPFMTRMWKIHGLLVWSRLMVVKKWEVPIFKHKKTLEKLYLKVQQNPPWMATKITSMAPGIVLLIYWWYILMNMWNIVSFHIFWIKSKNPLSSLVPTNLWYVLIYFQCT